MLDRTIIDSFRTRLRGPLLLPGEPVYDEGRAIWNAMIDRRPALIVRCLGVAVRHVRITRSARGNEAPPVVHELNPLLRAGVYSILPAR